MSRGAAAYQQAISTCRAPVRAPANDRYGRAKTPMPGPRRSGIGASRPLRRIPTIVSFPNPQPAVSLGGGSRFHASKETLNKHKVAAPRARASGNLLLRAQSAGTVAASRRAFGVIACHIRSRVIPTSSRVSAQRPLPNIERSLPIFAVYREEQQKTRSKRSLQKRSAADTLGRSREHGGAGNAV